ncbi:MULTISPECIES: hypothetical protein [unclassified Streptomyces]|uniref:hypothetical protein n=1 Tax=unclassified Streptomyces TaxID=2593676 RepID=UPI000BF34D84|nr:hypothetical protein [Streptomyces sp. Ru87]PGH48865.1 hypothetical protein CRI70_20690 [Streptomyces sp. Ru87]
MTYRHLTAAAALAACTALLVTGCGGSEDKGKDDDKIAGAEQDDKKSESPSASPSESADRPKITSPSDFSSTFEWPKTGDKQKDAVLADAQNRVKAVDMAIDKQDPAHKAYQFYSEGTAAVGSEGFISRFVDENSSITGTKRYYNARVDISDSNAASLVYCEDQSKAYRLNLKTGKAKKTTPSKTDYVLYASRLKKNENGVWVTVELTSQRGSETCQP